MKWHSTADIGRQSEIGLDELLSVHAVIGYPGEQALEVPRLKYRRSQRGAPKEVPSDGERHTVQRGRDQPLYRAKLDGILLNILTGNKHI